jgi:hypothetical protein
MDTNPKRAEPLAALDTQARLADQIDAEILPDPTPDGPDDRRETQHLKATSNEVIEFEDTLTRQ